MAEDRQTHEKRIAAEALAALVEPGMAVGLGTGSTAAFAIAALGRRVAAGLVIRGIPSSERTRRLATEAGIPLTSFDETPRLDLTIDGADEVDPQLDLVKGGGGALLREKVLAAASRRVAIMVDSGKLVQRLGDFPLPVEVVPFAWRPVADRIAALGGAPALRRGRDGAMAVTDQGNWLLDCRFGAIADPGRLAARLEALPGLVEHGLFVGLADTVAIGRDGTVEWLHRRP